MTDRVPDCTEACEAAPQCSVCRLIKRPRGRSVAVEAESSMCGWHCPGYNQEPRSGHLWPGEFWGTP